jgi:SAM-dependent methyltransferase
MPGTPQAPRYDALWTDVYGEMQAIGPVHRHMRRLLGESLARLDYRSAVDVGCGAGDNAELLRAGGSLERLVGVDISERALERARRRDAGTYALLDVERDALDERFDLVFSSLLLEHLPDDAAALRNMRSMTGRWLLVSTMAGDFDRYHPWEEQVGHVRNYARNELERKLEDAGFEVVEALYWGFPFYTPLARLLQNRARPTATYGPAARLAAAFLYRLYFLNSRRRGDLLIALARPRSPDAAASRIESSIERAGA